MRKHLKIYVDFVEPAPKWRLPNPYVFLPAVLVILALIIMLFAKLARAEQTLTLTASWYSVESLKKEGTFKYSKGVMANGELFSDDAFTCASRLHRLGVLLLVTNLANGKSVVVRVTDRIGTRFANKRIDLSRGAFAQIANLKQGVIPIKIEQIK